MEKIVFAGKLFAQLCACAALLAVGIVDEKTYEIPPICTGIVFAAGVVQLLLDRHHLVMYLAGMFCVSLPLFLLLVFSRGRAIGGGDVKLMAAAGLLLGWKKALLALELGCILGAVIHSLRVHFGSANHLLAFGPYLSAGIMIAMWWGDALIQGYLSWVIRSSCG